MLKITVIGMGVLIIAATVVIVVTIANRWGGDGAQSAAPYDVEASLPTGARLLETAADDGRIVLTLEMPDGGRALLILDAATGRKTGLVRLKPGG